MIISGEQQDFVIIARYALWKTRFNKYLTMEVEVWRNFFEKSNVYK